MANTFHAPQLPPVRPVFRDFSLGLIVLMMCPCARLEIHAASEQVLRIEQALRIDLGFADVDIHDYTGYTSVTGLPPGEITAGGSTQLIAVDVYPTTALAEARFALDRDYLLSDFAGNLEKGSATILANRLIGIVNRKAVTAYTTTTVEGKTRAIGGAEVLFQCDNLVVKVVLTSASIIAYPESNLEQLNAETERLGREAVAPVKTLAHAAVPAICGESTAILEITPQLTYSRVQPEEFLLGSVTLEIKGDWPQPALAVWVALYKEDESLTLEQIISGEVTTGNPATYALRTVSPVTLGTKVYKLGENEDLALKVPTEPGDYLLLAVAGDPIGGTGLNVLSQTGVVVERFPKRFYLRSAVVSPTLDGGVGDTFSLAVEFDVGSVEGPPSVGVRSNLTGPDPRGIPAIVVTNLTPIIGIGDEGPQTIAYHGTGTMVTPPLLYAGEYRWPFTLFAPGWEPIDGEGSFVVDFTGYALGVTGAVTVENESGTPLPATNVLRFGRRLRTPPGGEAVVAFPNGASMVVAPNTTVSVDSNGQVHVDTGTVALAGTAEPTVSTPLATVTPTGTEFSVTHNPTEPATTVSVTDGAVQVTPLNPAHPAVAVTAGQSIEVNADANIVPPPAISTQPMAATVIVGTNAQFSVSASSASNLSYQWQRKVAGSAIWSDLANDGGFSGATAATLSISAALAMTGDQFRVIVTSDAGSSATSTVGALAVTHAPRLLNLSTRGLAQTGDNVLIPGFVISGTASKRLLIRAVGPTLGKDPINLGGVLDDPRMRLLRRNTVTQVFEEIATNDNWGTNGNAADITATAASVSAFDFNDTLEAALLLDVAPGEYTVIAGGVNNSTGLAIVELYDADSADVDARLINISNRGFAGVGDDVMIPGFVISDEGPKTVLVRVVGPKLGSFGVSGTMVDPLLTVFSGQSPIHSNDNWSDDPDAATTTQVAAQVSAFALDGGSKDAAMVVTLQPGAYTVVGASAVAGGTGVVLVEIYVVP